MFSLLRRVNKDERGVTAIEYGLIAALIAVVLIAAVGQVGKDLDTTFTKIGSAMTKAAPK